LLEWKRRFNLVRGGAENVHQQYYASTFEIKILFAFYLFYNVASNADCIASNGETEENQE
jgi:hypothetical protein